MVEIQDQLMQFVALPKYAISNIHTSDIIKDKNWALISIDTNADWPELPEEVSTSDKFHGVLQLHFADINRPLLEYILFNDDHAKQVLEFYNKIKNDINLLVVHCYAGISRSTAVCAALSKIEGQSDEYFFNTGHPNSLVYRKLLETNER